MAGKSGLPEQLADLTFPLQGLDLTAEFELQRPGTTPICQNVRGYEALTERGRGGVRPGLSQYVPQQVSGSHLIQHLNYIVDPSADALGTTFDPLDIPVVPLGLGWGFGTPPVGGYPDYGFPTIVAGTPNPANQNADPGGVQMPNGFWTRTGGNGLQPNKNVGRSKSEPQPIMFVQGAQGFNFGPDFGQATFDGNVGVGDLFVLCLGYEYLPASVVSVSDSFGNLYTKACSTFLNGPHGFEACDIWWALSQHSGTNTITAQMDTTVALNMYILEYNGVTESLPNDGAAVNSDQSGETVCSTGLCSIHGPGELLVGMFTCDDSSGIAIDASFTTRFQQRIAFSVGDKIGLAVATAMTGTILVGSGTGWCAAAASFKPQVV